MQNVRLPITETDRTILLALSRFHYLTAAQASRLLYPSLFDNNRYMQRRLKRLVDAGFALRLRTLPSPRYGQQPHVFTLHQQGRRYLRKLGVPIPAYFRPSEEHQAGWNDPFMTHRLAAIDVLIAAEALCRVPDRTRPSRDSGVSCPRLLTERQLRHRPVRFAIPTGSGSRLGVVIPDGWFQLRVGTQDPYSIALEVDRATEDQSAWRRKVAGYAAWAQGPYREAFDTDNLTIAVVAPTRERRDQLRSWTATSLRGQDALFLADVFLFTAASPVTLRPVEFFFNLLWYLPHQPQPVSLLDPPEQHVEALRPSQRQSDFQTGRLPEEVLDHSG